MSCATTRGDATSGLAQVCDRSRRGAAEGQGGAGGGCYLVRRQRTRRPTTDRVEQRTSRIHPPDCRPVGGPPTPAGARRRCAGGANVGAARWARGARRAAPKPSPRRTGGRWRIVFPDRQPLAEVSSDLAGQGQGGERGEERRGHVAYLCGGGDPSACTPSGVACSPG